MAEGMIQMLQIVSDDLPAPSQAHDRYLQPRQAQWRTPTLYEDLLADAIERAYAQGIHDLPGLVESLNRQSTTTPAGQPWTVDNYAAAMADLCQ